MSSAALAGGSGPVTPGRLVSGIGYGLSTVVFRRKRPYLLGFVITDRCNLSCFYCESKNRGRIHFSYGAALAALRAGFARGNRSLYFTGGEPMIWSDGDRDLSSLVLAAREIGFHDVFVFTNGTRPLGIAGCKYIVTLDGPRDLHNVLRAGTYDLVIENSRNAATSSVFASMTISRANVDQIESFVRDTTSLGIFRGISFNLLTHGPEIVAQHGVSGERRREALDQIWRLKRQGFPIVLSRAAYRATRANDWPRPIPQIELVTTDRVYTCCRDVGNPSVCENCGYLNCVEVSQLLALRPSAIWQVLQLVR
jgi:sulfatase maturation enzyme AslB (radical SAM superfamily)